ncbi:MAG: DNA-processing protein DprA [Candidatus Limnocylindrales bacterium]
MSDDLEARFGSVERQAWICLASVDRVGEATLGLLIAKFRSAQQVLTAALDGTLSRWNLDRGMVLGRVPIPAPTMKGIESVARDPCSKLDAIAEVGLWTYTSLDANYPIRLRDLDPPPAVIHGLGDRTTLSRPRAVAVVGTRRPTPAGRVLATKICGRLVECGAVVVSGLAVGIDGAAHAAAVERDAPTVGVIGAGHNRPGLRAHARLRDEILSSGGALISEHHPGVGATKGTYPRRNRIIAALGDATIVIEAPRRSGALITANRALEMGRPVFAVPGRIGDWAVAGSLALLRETPAQLIVGLDELTEDLGFLAPAHDAATPSSGGRVPALDMLGPTERAVAQRLCDGPAGLDLLVAETGLPPGAISSAVTMLLMRGWAHSVGPAYIAAGPLAR